MAPIRLRPVTFLLLSITVFLAGQPTSQLWKLSTWVDGAVSRHPSVISADQAALAEIKKIGPAGAPGDPMVMAEWMKLPVSGMAPVKETAYSVTESFPFPARLGWLAAKQRAQAEASRALADLKAREVRKDLVRALIALAAVDRTLAVSRERLGQLRLMEAVVTGRYGSGKASQSEWGRVKVMAAMAKAEASMQEGERAQAWATLERYGAVPTNLSGISAILQVLPPISGAALPSREELTAKAVGTFPEVRMQGAMEKRMGAERAAMHWEWAPDVTVKGTLTQMETGDVNGAVGVGISIPLWFALRQAPNAQAAGLQASAEAEKARDARAQAALMTKMAHAMFTAAGASLSVLLDSAAPQAAQVVEVALKEYQVDRIPFTEMLETLKTVTDTDLEINRTRRAFSEAAVDLHFLTGVKLLPGLP